MECEQSKALGLVRALSPLSLSPSLLSPCSVLFPFTITVIERLASKKTKQNKHFHSPPTQVQTVEHARDGEIKLAGFPVKYGPFSSSRYCSVFA